MKLKISAALTLALVITIAAILLQAEKTSAARIPQVRVTQGDKVAAISASEVTQGELRILDKEGIQAGICPLKHTSVSAQISGFVARVDVTQEFFNDSEDKIEAIYVFPLPQDAAVDRMEMTVGERTIRGTVKEREEARQIYESAKQAGHVASLLDQERPNIFTQSVANILPGETVVIKISYVDLLKYENGRFEFAFPMVVGPRYIPGTPTGQSGEGWSPDTDETPDASRITPPVTPEGTRAGHDISVEVILDAGMPVEDIESVLHEVDVTPSGATGLRIALKDQATIPNRDFILRYLVAGDEVRTGLLPSTRSAGDGYFSLILVPPKSPKPSQIAPKEMIFVVDSSGSQMGWPIEKAKETMKICIEQMNPGDTFQMLAFSNEVIPLFDKPQPNTTENRALVQEFLASRLGEGGTEMMKAVVAALTPPPDPKRLRIVCFMTDGYVGNDFEILAAIKKHIGNARLFSFGIGNGVNRFLLDGMADMGRGAVEYVTLEEQGAGAAQKFYDRISKPILTNVSIDWGGLPVEDIYPERIPDLFSSKPVILKGRYTKGASGYITVKGMLGGQPWQEKALVTLPEEEDQNQALPSLWARAKIADLTANDYAGIQQGQPDPNIKEQVTQVALEYQLMSQFTSFVAVEEMYVTDGGVPKKVAVPVEMPEGVSYDGIFGAEPSLYSVAAGSPMQMQMGTRPSVAAKRSSVASGRLEELCDTEALPDTKTMTPEERKQYMIETRLDPLLRDLAKKLDGKGNYSEAGKIEVKGGKVLVSIRLSDDSEANLEKLKKLGFKLSASTKSVKMVIGSVTVSKLEELSLLDFVLKIAPVV